MEKYVEAKSNPEHMENLKNAIIKQDNKLPAYENFRFVYFYYLTDAIQKSITKSSRNIKNWMHFIDNYSTSREF